MQSLGSRVNPVAGCGTAGLLTAEGGGQAVRGECPLIALAPCELIVLPALACPCPTFPHVLHLKIMHSGHAHRSLLILGCRVVLVKARRTLRHLGIPPSRP